MPSWKPDVFEYLNYREFLADYYAAAKDNVPRFSYRYFGRRAGYTSPNFLKLVIDGQRNLSHDSIERFADALGLNRFERRFFGDLVDFNQANNDADRNVAYDRLAASRRYRRARRLDHAYFSYLSTWYYPAIREMTARPDFVEDNQWIAAQLLPSISPQQAGSALELLLELGLVQRDKDGKLTRGEPSITTGHEVNTLAIANYHREMLNRAAESLEIIESEFRDISGLTVCISPELVPDLKSRLQTFRENLMHLCDSDPNPSILYQVNLQLFPLNDPHAGEDR